jgi:hypothetical protein
VAAGISFGATSSLSVYGDVPGCVAGTSARTLAIIGHRKVTRDWTNRTSRWQSAAIIDRRDWIFAAVCKFEHLASVIGAVEDWNPDVTLLVGAYALDLIAQMKSPDELPLGYE